MNKQQKPIGRAIVLILAGWTCGCMTWRVTKDPLETVLAKAPSAVRITAPEFSKTIVTKAELKNDSFIGLSGKSRIAVPRSSIAVIETRGVSTGQMLVVGMGGLVMFATVLSYLSAHCDNGC